MTERELTPEQEHILKHIPDFFQWHVVCRKQVEGMVKEMLNKNKMVEEQLEFYKNEYLG